MHSYNRKGLFLSRISHNFVMGIRLDMDIMNDTHLSDHVGHYCFNEPFAV